MKASDVLDRLSKLPRPQRLVIYAVAGVLLLVAWWFSLMSPSVDKLDSLEKERTNLAAQLAQVETRAKNLAALEAELETLKADLKQALKELPNDREIPGLLKGISTLGRNVGLEVRKFQPMPEKKREYVAEVPVTLEVEGSYHEVAMFFDRLAKMNRIVYIQNITLGSPDDRGGKVVLKVGGQAVTFRFLSDEEIASAKKAKEGKGKKGNKGGGE